MVGRGKETGCRRRISLCLMLCLVVLLHLCAGCSNQDVQRLEGPGEITQAFQLKKYAICEKGLLDLIQRLAEYADLPEKSVVTYFEADLTSKGLVEDFNLNLAGFDAEGIHLGDYSFRYAAKEKSITVTYTLPDETSPFNVSYNENSDPAYLDSQIKRLPLVPQMARLDFASYTIWYYRYGRLQEGTPVLDGNGKDFPVLSGEEYRTGTGGVSDGRSAVYFTLRDRAGAQDGNALYYLCTPADEDSLQGNKDQLPRDDYKISDNQLYFTGDWGETWHPVDISEEDLAKTLDFYKTDMLLPEDSYYISEDEKGPVAFFYGENPTLCLSVDGGESWKSIPFDLFEGEVGRPVTKRVVGFAGSMEGYVALGTDWSMGGGEAKALFLTHDGGATWEEKPLPLSGSSSTLEGVCFSDGENGVLSLDTSSDDLWPLLYYTETGGDGWQELTLPYEQIPEQYFFLTGVDSLSMDAGMYTLVLDQGPYGNDKASFESDSLNGEWRYVDNWKDVPHTVG